MYQVEAWSALRRVRRDADGGFGWRHVGGTVWALGFTSLFTDVSSEMVATVLPVYLVLYLGLTPFQFGIVDGLYHGVTALLRLASGVAVDRTGRSKEIALAGYGASAVSRLAMLAAGASWPLIAGVVAFDRAAKGARAVPRDVLISLSSRPEGLATAFGVHRALDSAGAMLGPLIALAILGILPNAFDVIFVASFSVAVIGLGVLMLFVTNAERPQAPALADASGAHARAARFHGGDARVPSAPTRADASGAPPATTARAAPAATRSEAPTATSSVGPPTTERRHASSGGRLSGPLAGRDPAHEFTTGIVRVPGLLRLTATATLLGAATVSDGFLYLLLQQEAGFSPGLFPLLYVGTSGCYLALAVPAGGLADRIGRRRAFLAGYGLLAAAYLTTMQSGAGLPGVAACLVLLGAHYALTDGVLMAVASGRLSPKHRGSGLALITTGASLARLLGSVLFGALWTSYGTGTAVPVFLIALAGALAVAAVLLADREGRPRPEVAAGGAANHDDSD